MSMTPVELLEYISDKADWSPSQVREALRHLIERAVTRALEKYPGSGKADDLEARRISKLMLPDPQAWTKLKPVPKPACDICMQPAAYEHPLGGLRCPTCPRPEAK